MGIRTETQTLLAEAFSNESELADAVKSFTIKQYSRGQYDPSTGSLSGSAFPNSYTSRGVFDEYNQPETLNSAVEPGDVRLIVLQNELEIVPKIGDVVIESSTEFRVVGIGKDPADVTWDLQVRSTA